MNEEAEKRAAPDRRSEEKTDDHGFGRSAPLNPDEQDEIASDQARRIATGEARQGSIALRTPLHRAIYAAGLIGVFVLSLILLLTAD